METPVLFIIFNRPEQTRRVFAAIRAARPRILLLVADGPRVNRPGERELCQETRSVAQQVDWPCRVLCNFAEENLGCGKRVSSGISWAFQQFERVIILEDDCVPHRTFFSYCDALLDRYADDERVMHIGGSNFQCQHARSPYSYFFSKYIHVWGWATWRRAWAHYDFSMANLPEFVAGGGMSDLGTDPDELEYWVTTLEGARENRIDTWDYQWVYTCWSQRGLAVHPAVNLVSNIGFGADATHTQFRSPLMNNPTYDLGELRHPPHVFRHVEADRFSFDYAYGAKQRRDERTLRYQAAYRLYLTKRATKSLIRRVLPSGGAR